MKTNVWRSEKWMLPFFIIWGGQVLSWVGSRVAMFALIWWLTDKTGSATVLASATLAAMLPQIVLGPIAGVYVDRWNRRLVMIAADGLIALVSLWLAILFWTGEIQVWHVYVIMVVRELGGMFHWPAMQSSTSLMVPKEHLARVAGLNQAINGALSIVGPALGALVLAVGEIHHAMLMDVITAVLAITPLLFVFIPQPERAQRDAETKPSVWTDLREGASYVFHWRGLMILTGMALVFKIALTPAFSLLPLLVKSHFDGEAPQLAGMQAAFGIGIILGGLLLGIWGGFKPRILTTIASITAIGFLLIILGGLPPAFFMAAVAVMFVSGAAVALCDGPLFAALQSTIAPEIQGRVFMIFISLVNLTGPIGLAIAGPVTDWAGIQLWYIVAGVLCAAMGIAGFFIPAVVNFEDNRPASVSPLPMPAASD
ncbi:MAG: MFS transporter [Chloroflexi bacterium]|nr:MFS transporter [Chloroflexota bacterium]